MRVWNQIRWVLVTFLLLAAAVLYEGSASPAWAQSTNTGTLAGTVTDAVPSDKPRPSVWTPTSAIFAMAAPPKQTEL